MKSSRTISTRFIQLRGSLVILSALFIGYFLGIDSLQVFFKINGELHPNLYKKHKDDFCVILLSVLMFTFIREFFMHFFIQRTIVKTNKFLKNRVVAKKFKEQAWLSVYYLISWTSGFYLYYYSEYYFNLDYVYYGYPHYLSGSFKIYYLVQLGFWIQQIIHLYTETRRKDFKFMIIHHIVTVSLLGVSYYANFTRIGHVVLMLMDFSDIFLSLAKTLTYLKKEIMCNVMFVVFLISWIVTRHILYMKIFFSILWDAERLRKYEWDPENGCYYVYSVKYIALFLLSILQILIILWLFMILKVAKTIVKGDNMKDIRSEDENSSSDIDNEINKNK